MKNRWIAALAALLVIPTQAQAQAAGSGTIEAPDDGAAVKGRVDAMEEQLTEAKGTLEKLAKIKLSGYVQGRYQLNEATNLDVPLVAPLPATGNEGFSVRRGRLKAVYDGKVSEYVLQIDATPTGVALKSAEATLKLPWIGGWVMLGQSEMPFGYETQASSSDLALLERSRVVQAFLPGEYDRGVKAYASWRFVNLKVGVTNGNTTSYRGYTIYTPTGAVNVAVAPTGLDNDQKKDVLGRAGVDLGFLVAGVSGWYGQTLANPALAGTARIAGTGRYFDRTRVGVDAQLYLDLLPLGGTSLKGEFIAGKTPYSGGREQLGIPAHGWYAQVQQAVGTGLEVAARYDSYDPRNGSPAVAGASGRYVPSTANSQPRIDTIAYALHWYADSNLKISLLHEIPFSEKPSANPANPLGGNENPPAQVFTAQLQAKF